MSWRPARPAPRGAPVRRGGSPPPDAARHACFMASFAGRRVQPAVTRATSTLGSRRFARSRTSLVFPGGGMSSRQQSTWCVRISSRAVGPSGTSRMSDRPSKIALTGARTPGSSSTLSTTGRMSADLGGRARGRNRVHERGLQPRPWVTPPRECRGGESPPIFESDGSSKSRAFGGSERDETNWNAFKESRVGFVLPVSRS